METIDVLKGKTLINIQVKMDRLFMGEIRTTIFYYPSETRLQGLKVAA